MRDIGTQNNQDFEVPKQCKRAPLRFEKCADAQPLEVLAPPSSLDVSAMLLPTHRQSC